MNTTAAIGGMGPTLAVRLQRVVSIRCGSAIFGASPEVPKIPVTACCTLPGVVDVYGTYASVRRRVRGDCGAAGGTAQGMLIDRAVRECTRERVVTSLWLVSKLWFVLIDLVESMSHGRSDL